MPTTERLADVIAADASLSDDERRAIIEIAAAAVAADRAIHQKELEILRSVAAKLGVTGEAAISKLFAGLGQATGKAADRVRAAAAQLTSAAAKETAYKVAHAITLADDYSSPAESTFDRELAVALSLSSEDATRLGEEAAAALRGS